jgi:hypothetical protein
LIVSSDRNNLMRVFKDQAVLVAVWEGLVAVLAAAFDDENGSFCVDSLNPDEYPFDDEEIPTDPGLHVWEGSVVQDPAYDADGDLSDYDIECEGTWRLATMMDLRRFDLPFLRIGMVRTCSQCGCTDDRACPGGCSWVAWDLCSACAPVGQARDDDMPRVPRGPTVAELKEALEQSVRLQSHYATLLNQYDGGARIGFPTADDWIRRLRECPDRYPTHPPKGKEG